MPILLLRWLLRLLLLDSAICMPPIRTPPKATLLVLAASIVTPPIPHSPAVSAGDLIAFRGCYF